ncbi:hemagglutinin repeat-containing protein [Cupriavidus plantarum]|uniref:two-partner secretion domain-containing protein n=1 Tax=Cupriavidus plantarum TaxID=942865 RepID=UPI001B0072C8|nr:hemagglutinin repeat-containing protein [Cupriavidus plantarum]CAG2127808.1 hypothetical protein LMG26296_00852 [Cupriavidus plantarum]SMR67014.1 filamentous hemagglutinin family N-terminal domain-containing protein [Cupriavidus plantarum]
MDTVGSVAWRMVWPVSVACVTTPGLLSIAWAQAEPSAAPAPMVVSAGGARMSTANNGVPVINIEAANEAGVSHNRFSKFNVSSVGLILNNIARGSAPTNTTLGGGVHENENLTRAAHMIVNEVISGHRSEIDGFMEVAGKKADLIIANPSGITCSNCGFLNVDRVMLGAGTSIWRSGGAFAGVLATEGDILIRGHGLNAAEQTSADLVAGKIRLDAPVFAKKLHMFAGGNWFDFGARRLMHVGRGRAKGLAGPAIDSSTLGGMHADRIHLVANDRGAGVRLGGHVLASGSLQLRVPHGALAIGPGAKVVGSSANVAAAQVHLDKRAELVAMGKLTVVADAMTLDGDTAETARVRMSETNNGDGNIQIGKTFANKGLVFSGRGLNLSAGRIENAGTGAIAARDLTLHANAGELDLREKGGSLNAGKLVNHGLILGNDRLKVTANGELVNAGRILGGENGTMTIRANTLINNRDIDGAVVDIVAATLQNRVPDERRVRFVDQSAPYVKEGPETYRWAWSDFTYRYYQNYSRTVKTWYEFMLDDPGYAPRILAAKDMKIAASRLTNRGGIIWSGDVLRLQGFTEAPGENVRPYEWISDDRGTRFQPSGAQLDNDSLSLESRVEVLRHTKTRRDTLSYLTPKFGWRWCGPNAQPDEACTYQGEQTEVTSRTFNNVLKAGIAARAILGDGFTIVNRGERISDARQLLDPSIAKGLEKTGEEQSTFDTLIARENLGNPNGLFQLAVQSNGRYVVERNPIFVFLPPGKGGGSATRVQSPPAGQGQKGTDVTEDAMGDVADSGVAKKGAPPPLSNPLSNPRSDPLPSPPAPSVTGASAGTAASAKPLAQRDGMDTDMLADSLGYDTRTLDRRLGDAAFEQHLVRQQLIDQTGVAVQTRFRSANEQMWGLMREASRVATSHALVYGRALTAEQIAQLDDDIVWVVRQRVLGQNVLVPVVYLSPKARKRVVASAQIIAETMDLKVDGFRNEGGGILANQLRIKSTSDIVNTSGTMAGGKVALQAGGSIVNGTAVHRGDTLSATLDVTGTIVAGKTMTLAADKDIAVTGAELVSGGDMALDAGKRITIDTREHRSTTSTVEGGGDGSASSMETSTVSHVGHHRSRVMAAGNLDAKSGAALTLSGAEVQVGGDAALKSGEDIRVDGKMTEQTAWTRRYESGVGHGGALFGTTDVREVTRTAGNVASEVGIGGNATLSAKGDLRIRGSTWKTAGDLETSAANIEVAAAETSTVSTRTEASHGIFATRGATHRHTQATAGSGVLSRGNDNWLGAGVAARGSAEGGIDLFRDVSETTTQRRVRHDAAVFEAGGDARLIARDGLRVTGSRVHAEGDLTQQATTITTEAVEDRDEHAWRRSEASLGVHGSAGGGAQASIGAAPEGEQAGGLPSADVNADAGLKFRHANDRGVTGSTTALTSAVSAGRDIVRYAGEAMRDVGTDLRAGGDVKQSADTIVSEAAHDTTYSASESGEDAAFVGGYGAASVGLPGRIVPGQSKQTLKSGAGAGAGLKIEYRTEARDTDANTRTAVVSTVRAGGNVSSESRGETRLAGTDVKAGGDIDIRGATVAIGAAHDTEASRAKTASAGAAVHVDKVSPGVGVSGDGMHARDTREARRAVAGRLVAQRDVAIRASGDASFEGARVEGDSVRMSAGGNVAMLTAKTSRAASESRWAANGGVSIGVASWGGDAGGNVSDMTEHAVSGQAGRVQARRGTVEIRSGGDAKFEGTALSAATKVQVDAAGSIVFDVARETISRKRWKANANLGVGRADGATGVSSPGAFAGTSGYERETERAGSIEAASVALASGGDTTLAGTTVKAGTASYRTEGALIRTEAKPETVREHGGNVLLPPVFKPAHHGRPPAGRAGVAKPPVRLADGRMGYLLGPDKPPSGQDIGTRADASAQAWKRARMDPPPAAQGRAPDSARDSATGGARGGGARDDATDSGMRTMAPGTGRDDPALGGLLSSPGAPGAPGAPGPLAGDAHQPAHGEPGPSLTSHLQTEPLDLRTRRVIEPPGEAAGRVGGWHAATQPMTLGEALIDRYTVQLRQLLAPQPDVSAREADTLTRLARRRLPAGDRPHTERRETALRLSDYDGPFYGAYQAPRGHSYGSLRPGETVIVPSVIGTASLGYARLQLAAVEPERRKVLMVFDGSPAKSLAPFSPFQGANARAEVYAPERTRLRVSDIVDTQAMTFVGLGAVDPGATSVVARDLHTGNPHRDYDHRFVVPLEMGTPPGSQGSDARVRDASRSLRHKHADTTLVALRSDGAAAEANPPGGTHKYTVVGEGHAGNNTLGGRRAEEIANIVAPLARHAIGCKVSLVGCHSAAMEQSLRAALYTRGIEAEVSGRKGYVRVSDRGHKYSASAGHPDALNDFGRKPFSDPDPHRRLREAARALPLQQATADRFAMQNHLLNSPDQPRLNKRERDVLAYYALRGRPAPGGDRPIAELSEVVSKLGEYRGTVYLVPPRELAGAWGRTIFDGSVVANPWWLLGSASRGYAQYAMRNAAPGPDGRKPTLAIIDDVPAKVLAPFSLFQHADGRAEVVLPRNQRMKMQDHLETDRIRYVWFRGINDEPSDGVLHSMNAQRLHRDYDRRVVVPLDDSHRVAEASLRLNYKHADSRIALPHAPASTLPSPFPGRLKISLVGEGTAGVPRLSARSVPELADIVAPLARGAHTCKISLVGCHSVQLERPLQQALRDRSVDAEVHGRVSYVAVSDEGGKRRVGAQHPDALGKGVSFDPDPVGRTHRHRAEGVLAHGGTTPSHGNLTRGIFREMTRSMPEGAITDDRMAAREWVIDSANANAAHHTAFYGAVARRGEFLEPAQPDPLMARHIHDDLLFALNKLPGNVTVSYLGTRTQGDVYGKRILPGDLVGAGRVLASDKSLQAEKHSAVYAERRGLPTVFRIDGRSGRNEALLGGPPPGFGPITANGSAILFEPHRQFTVLDIHRERGAVNVLLTESRDGASPHGAKDMFTGAPSVVPSAPNVGQRLHAMQREFSAEARAFDKAGARRRLEDIAVRQAEVHGAPSSFTRGMARQYLRHRSIFDDAVDAERRGGKANSNVAALSRALQALPDTPGRSYMAASHAGGVFGSGIVAGDTVVNDGFLVSTKSLAAARDEAARGTGGVLFSIDGRHGKVAIDGPDTGPDTAPELAPRRSRKSPRILHDRFTAFDVEAVNQTAGRTDVLLRERDQDLPSRRKDMRTGRAEEWF